MSKLSLPPLNQLPAPAQAAFRAVASWANSLDQQVTDTQRQENQKQQIVINRTVQSAVDQATKAALDAANAVVVRRSADMVRQVLENSGTQPYLQMNAPVLFQATNTVGNRDYKLFIGAGGLLGGYSPAGSSDNTVTFGIATEDGSFFFGAEDTSHTADPAWKQIKFDAVNNVMVFGSAIQLRRSDGTLETLEEVASNQYATADLEADLAAGVGTVVAGLGGGYGFTTDAGGVYFYRSGAVHNGYSPTADSTNTPLPMVAITANGIAMGYNAADGTWQNSVAIDASGNATFLGTVAANSVVSASAYIGSTLAGTVVSGAASGAAAAAALTSKLDKNASYVMEASSEFKTSGYDGGNGMTFTNNGILAKKGGVTKFAITATGDATFAGSLSAATGTFAGSLSAASGSFNGDVVTSGDASFSGRNTSSRSAVIAGTSYQIDYSVWADATSSASSSSNVRAGVMGYAISSTSAYDVGIIGTGYSATKGIGVVGNGPLYGGYFYSGAGTGIYATSSTGNALYVSGTMAITNSTVVTNLNADYLDGLHASAFAQADSTHTYKWSGGTVTGSATATFSGTKPGSSATNSWLKLIIDGGTYYIPIWG